MTCLLGSWASCSVPGMGWTPKNEAGVCPPGAHALEQNFSALCWNPLPIVRNRTTITVMLVSQCFLFKTLFPSLHPLTYSNIYLELEQIFKYPYINTYYLHSHMFVLVKGSSWHLVINCSPSYPCHKPYTLILWTLVMYVMEERGENWTSLVHLVKRNLKTDHMQWVKFHLHLSVTNSSSSALNYVLTF